MEAGVPLCLLPLSDCKSCRATVCFVGSRGVVTCSPLDLVPIVLLLGVVLTAAVSPLAAVRLPEEEEDGGILRGSSVVLTPEQLRRFSLSPSVASRRNMAAC